MPTALLTGFPGFLASAFLPNLLSRTDPQTRVTCLVQPHFRAMAEERAKSIAAKQPDWGGRIRLVEGDITRPDLGLTTEAKELQSDTREAYHLAAVYDLAVPRSLGMRINVEGTAHVLDFVEAARLQGEGLRWIMSREILPNILPPIVVEFGLRFCFVFLTISALSFLGLGIKPPTADWGSMVRENATLINYGDVTPLLPAGAIALLTVAVNFVVDWLLHKTSGLKDER